LKEPLSRVADRPDDAGSAPAGRRLFELVLERRDAIDRVYHVLTFKAEGGLSRSIHASPGQFAMVRSPMWGDDPLLPRPMSLLTAGDRPSILIKVVGKGTGRMALAAPGEPFHLLAPLGRPWSPCPPDHRMVLVAGGVGVAPLLFLAQRLATAGGASAGGAVSGASAGGAVSGASAGSAVSGASGAGVLALYGGRTSADLPLSSELEAASELRVATEDGSRGTRGRVTALLEQALDELTAQGAKAKVYTCGPNAMMAAVARMCEARGALCEVSLETPMACGYGVCLGCPVPHRAGGFLYACMEGPCIDATSIDWSRGAP
jgi:dihydroorotate dehydrogenase electron transfer subunit